MPPIPNVMALGRVCPGLAVPCTSCFNVVYVVNLTAEFAPCRIIYSHVRLLVTLFINTCVPQEKDLCISPKCLPVEQLLRCRVASHDIEDLDASRRQ